MNIHGIPDEATLAAYEKNGAKTDPSGWFGPDPTKEPYGQTFRTCFYCGSIHPYDLLRAMMAHPVALERTDRKYGYPHKFYVEGIPNPLAGKPVSLVSTSASTYHYPDFDAFKKAHPESDGWCNHTQKPHETHPEITSFRAEQKSPAHATSHAKFYTKHIADVEGDKRTALIEAIQKRTGIIFSITDDGVLLYAG